MAVKAVKARQTVTLENLRASYLATQQGAQEKKSLDTATTHFKHLAPTLPPAQPCDGGRETSRGARRQMRQCDDR